MSSPAVFLAVGTALKRLLDDALKADPQFAPNGVTVDFNDPKTPPPGGGAANRVSLWLYHVAADEFTRNLSMPTALTAASKVRFDAPPLGLTLGYLLTPMLGTADHDLRCLAVAMRALHDNAIVRLVDPAAGVSEELRIGLAPEPFEERAKVWEALGEKYRLSVAYQVRPVRLDSQRAASAPPVAEVTGELGETVPGAVVEAGE